MFKDYIMILASTLQRIHRQYIRYESALDDTLIRIENLNSGYLMHRILDPQILGKYLEAVEDDLEETAPEFEPVFTSVYQYYGNSLISFTNQHQNSTSSIRCRDIYRGEKRVHSNNTGNRIALTETNYVPLTQVQILLCAKIGYMYYCEYAHLLNKCTEHTCMSAIYYDQGSDIKAKQCKTNFTFNTILESKILDASNLLILSNLQKS